MFLGERVKTIGLIGGGQLGRMMIYRSKKLGFNFAVLDSADAPAKVLTDTFIEGSLKDPAALERLADASDVLTYEIEHINTDALEDLYARGHKMYPSPAVLRIIQDKLLQKELFVKKGIPTAAYFAEEQPALADFSAKRFPLVQKTRKEGYDGRGVRVLRNIDDKPMNAPSLFEDMVDIDKELAVMVARSRDGALAVFPVTEMAFNPAHNICDTVISPARIDEKTAVEARKIAISVIDALGGIGIFGIELFLDKYGEGNDIVYGIRNARNTDSVFKKATASLFYSIMKMLGAKIHKNSADYRLISKRAILALMQYKETNLFLRGILPLVGFKTDVVYFDVQKRTAGTSKYTLGKMFTLALNGITSLSIKPIRAIMLIGAISFIISIVLAIVHAVLYFTGHILTPGLTTIVLSIWALGGLQLVAIGIVGEYIGKTYIETKQRPRYEIWEFLK